MTAISTSRGTTVARCVGESERHTFARVSAETAPGAARVLHPRRGPHDPAGPPPPRRPGSVRRTTTHDSIRPDGLLADVCLDARGRDVLTEPDGSATVLRAVRLHATIDYRNGRTITALVSDPPADGIGELVGTRASSGFRRAVEACLPEERTANSLRFQLLDDVPTAALVSGHAIMAGGVLPPRGAVSGKNADLCAGWATGASIMIGIAEIGYPPIVTGPVAPDPEPDDDPLAWHDVEPLAPHAMRRRRRIDVWRDSADRIAVDAFFRDSHVDGGGLETVVHEYSVTATIDPATMRFTDCQATVGALPWQECPRAVASAGRLVGAPTEGLRAWVRGSFVGTSTCTHLNDTLRALEDVGDLVTALPRG